MAIDNERWSGGKRLDAVLRVCEQHGLVPSDVDVSGDSVQVHGLSARVDPSDIDGASEPVLVHRRPRA